MANDTAAITWLESYDEVCEAFSHSALLQASYDLAKKSVFADVLVTLDGPEHIQRRKTEMALLRPPAVSFLERERMPEMARRILAEFAPAGEADLVEVLRIATTALAAEIVGLDDCESVARLDRLERLTRQLHAGATVEWSLRDVKEIEAEATLAREQYRAEFFQPSLDRRKKAGNTPAPDADARPDLLSILLAHPELAMDEAKMLRESIHFLVATSHTSSGAVIHAFDDLWHWLADHPQDTARLGDEAFLQSCIFETLRLKPPTGFMKRRASTEVVLKSGRRLHAGEEIGLNMVTAGRDPKAYGPDAARYAPDRVVKPPVPRFGLAFGLGPHICIGKRLSTGAVDAAQGAGTLVALLRVLLEFHASPHPDKAPVEQAGTLRHQYRSYVVRFDPAARAAPARHRPLPAVAA